MIYDPDLLPPTRYIADHKGVDGFVRAGEQEARWRAHLGRAHVLCLDGRLQDMRNVLDKERMY